MDPLRYREKRRERRRTSHSVCTHLTRNKRIVDRPAVEHPARERKFNQRNRSRGKINRRGGGNTASVEVNHSVHESGQQGTVRSALARRRLRAGGPRRPLPQLRHAGVGRRGAGRARAPRLPRQRGDGVVVGPAAVPEVGAGAAGAAPRASNVLPARIAAMTN